MGGMSEQVVGEGAGMGRGVRGERGGRGGISVVESICALKCYCSMLPCSQSNTAMHMCQNQSMIPGYVTVIALKSQVLAKC